MAKKNELDILISNDGSVTVNVIDGKGKTCLDLTRELEESLGIVADREIKASFYDQDETQKVMVHGENE